MLRLDELARDDLDGIWDYTARTWNIDQAEKYLRQLEGCFDALLSGEAVHRDFHQVDGLGFFRCQKHFIFFTRTDNNLLVVVRILHQSQDFIRYLQHLL